MIARPRFGRAITVYLAMVALTVAAFFLIRWLGESQFGQPAANSTAEITAATGRPFPAAAT